VVAKLTERLSVSKRATQKFDMQRFYLKKLNDAEAEEQCQVEVPNRYGALENLDNNVNINRVCENIRGNTKFSTKDSLGH
jgi:hypothetical protein